MTELMGKLKPCPFCGGEAILSDVSRGMGKPKYAVVCTKCGASSIVKTPSRNRRSRYWELDKQEVMRWAVKAWNRRVNDDHTV